MVTEINVPHCSWMITRCALHRPRDLIARVHPSNCAHPCQGTCREDQFLCHGVSWVIHGLREIVLLCTGLHMHYVTHYNPVTEPIVS